jgi:hypothetical protein
MTDHARIRVPHSLFLRALPFVSQWDNIIDIGAGYLNETIYLLEKGYNVTALDRNPLPGVLVPKVTSNLTYLKQDFHTYPYPPYHYNLIISLFSLSFTEPAVFGKFFTRVIDATARHGVFVGNIFSKNDDWNNHSLPGITFLTKKEVEKFFSPEFEMIECRDREWDGPQYDGVIKHWHTVDFIAKRSA